MRATTSILFAAASCAIGATVCLAGDEFPPSPSNPLAPWVRGQPGTTFNQWNFPTPAPNPDHFGSNPTIAPGSLINPDGSIWSPSTSIPDHGLWTIPPGGFLDFFIPNFGPSSGPKFVYIQIKFSGALPGWGTLDPDTGAQGHHYPGEPVVTPGPSPFPGVYQWSDTLMFDYNPRGEIIHIFNPSAQDPSMIHQVVIDTICTPTPGTFAVLGLGLLAGARRRR